MKIFLSRRLSLIKIKNKKIQNGLKIEFNGNAKGYSTLLYILLKLNRKDDVYHPFLMNKRNHLLAFHNIWAILLLQLARPCKIGVTQINDK